MVTKKYALVTKMFGFINHQLASLEKVNIKACTSMQDMCYI